MHTLYLVATPIGNLEDITLRALRVLKEADLIAAEDTRSARNLLAHFGITTPVTSYFEHNKLTKLDFILNALERGDVAVISEAGMPGLSDPGYELVRAALARHIRVVPIPGASALTTALVASGLPTDQFVYLGFLPRQKNARRKLLQSVADETRTLVAYDAPHRVRASLDDIAEILGDRMICVARELTKVFEEFIRGRVSQARTHFATHEPRGEFTLVIEGKTTGGRQQTTESRSQIPLRGTKQSLAGKQKAEGKGDWSDARVRKEVGRLMKNGIPRTEAVKRVARESGRARREVYRITANK